MNTKTLAMGALVLAAGASQAFIVDTFDGHTAANLFNQQYFFPAGNAATDFNFYGDSTTFYTSANGDMDEGYFSVVNKASDVHTQFVSNLDADNNPNGNYAVFNGFNIPDVDKAAWRTLYLGATVGQQYEFGAWFLTLAPNPPYAQPSYIRIQGGDEFVDIVLTPTANPTWQYHSLTFTADGNDQLAIWNQNTASDAGNDFGIDNITLDPVPEPATMTVLALGALAALRRKRAK